MSEWSRKLAVRARGSSCLPLEDPTSTPSPSNPLNTSLQWSQSLPSLRPVSSPYKQLALIADSGARAYRGAHRHPAQVAAAGLSDRRLQLRTELH